MSTNLKVQQIGFLNVKQKSLQTIESTKYPCLKLMKIILKNYTVVLNFSAFLKFIKST